MTMALCFNCGATKFGAICPCAECAVSSTGDMGLDIAFSDHHMSVRTIEGFGAAVRAIRAACPDDELRFWSFLRYVTIHKPSVLTVNMAPDREAECDGVLARANPPPVEVEAAGHGRYAQELEERGENP